jgi:1-acylglycerone phosphate reductase
MRASSIWRLDILFNNAVADFPDFRNPAIDSACQQSEKLFSTSFSAIAEMDWVFAELVIAAKGEFAFTGNLVAMLPLPIRAVYNAIKGAMDSYINTLWLEIQLFGVQVVNDVTGGVGTEMCQPEKMVEKGKQKVSSWL